MTGLTIRAVGMVTPLGFNARASLAAIRAGIRNVSEDGIWDFGSGSEVPVGRVRLPHWWMGTEKLAELVAPAIKECFVAAQPTPPEQIPILLGVPGPDRPARWENLDHSILNELEHRLEISFHATSRIIARDRVSGIAGLQEAATLLSDRDVEYCVVAGVDSFLHPEMINTYLERNRILTKANSNGFSPGEAGTACLVERRSHRTNDGLDVLAVSLTREDATIDSERPLRAEGLTAAYRQVFAETGLSAYEMDFRITDLNGEHYKFKEAELADLRFVRAPKEKLYDLWHPIEFMGDIGAAIVPCVLGVALHAGSTDCGIGPTALLHFGSDDGERAAAIVRYEPTGSKR